MNALKFSYFQLTFGQEKAYLDPEKSYERFRDSNSPIPGCGTVDFKAVIRAIKKIDYQATVRLNALLRFLTLTLLPKTALTI